MSSTNCHRNSDCEFHLPQGRSFSQKVKSCPVLQQGVVNPTWAADVAGTSFSHYSWLLLELPLTFYEASLTQEQIYALKLVILKASRMKSASCFL